MEKKDLLVSEFLKGKVSRRDFQSGLMSLGLGAAAAAALVKDTISRTHASEPKTGGSLRAAFTGSSAADTLDPTLIVGSADIGRSGLLYNRLIDYLPDQGIVGNLATSWEPNEDATRWTIELLDGVEFHNGKTLTAADVAYSFNRHLDPDEGSPANAYLGDVESITTDGDKYVVFNMKTPNADVPYLLTEYHFTAQPEGSDKASYHTVGAVGTGAWKVREYEPGIFAVFERHPNYHRTGRPYVDEIESWGIPDPSSRVNALLGDEVDIMIGLDPPLVNAVAEASNAEVLNQPGGAHPTYPMRCDQAPYSDNNVRMALKHAVDRERMLQLGWDNLGTVGRDHPIPQHDPFFAADIEALPRDPDMAAYYLKQAGMENASFELHASEDNFGGANASVVMAELMNEAGVNVTVKRVPADGYWNAVWMKVPWCGSSWYGRPTADLMFAIAYISGGSWNETFWSHERFDQLVAEARSTVDTDLRKELYRECQLILRDEGGSVIPVFTNWLDAYHSRVKDLKGHPHGYGGWMYWEDVWLDT